jgi:hypothetical protein
VAGHGGRTVAMCWGLAVVVSQWLWAGRSSCGDCDTEARAMGARRVVSHRHTGERFRRHGSSFVGPRAVGTAPECFEEMFRRQGRWLLAEAIELLDEYFRCSSLSHFVVYITIIFDRFPIQEIVGSIVLRRTKFGVVWRLLLYMQERQKRGYWHTLHCLLFALLMQLDPIVDRRRYMPPKTR